MRFERSMVGVLITSLLLSACGTQAASGRPGVAGRLEKDTLDIGVVPVPDAAPLFIAIKKGFFEQEGLRVEPRILEASPQATPKLIDGSMDLALLNYVATFVAQDKGVADFRLVADSYQGGPKSFAILTRPNSSLRVPRDLKGKRVAVAAARSITHLLMTSALTVYGLGPEDVKVVPMALPDMEGALRRGAVDAIAAVEPFITGSEANMGARIMLDLVSGPTEQFPIAGWGGTDAFVQKHPRTVAAFQRAIGRAALIAATDRSEVNRVIPTYTRIPAETASVITLGTYPTSLNYQRMRRVADALTRFAYIKRDIDVRRLIVPPGGAAP
jgi:NitT/TauT family transport system substrate-binding protein